MLVDILRGAIERISRATPPPPEDPAETDLGPWRDRIDEIDRIIVHLLNERSRCANVIGHIKKKLALAVYAPRREEQVLQNVLGTNPGPLHDEAIRRVFERIIDETRALERQKYQNEPDDADGVG